MRLFLPVILLILLGICSTFSFAGKIEAKQKYLCEPTAYDEIGPFYRPDAPLRNSVGAGYLLTGHVLAAETCQPIKNAKIEFWLVGPGGNYDDDHRGIILSDSRGQYSLQSNHPPHYVGRPPHIHFMVTVEGYERLITQHYPEIGDRKAVFNFVLVSGE